MSVESADIALVLKPAICAGVKLDAVIRVYLRSGYILCDSFPSR
jgi:hypothetical protein